MAETTRVETQAAGAGSAMAMVRVAQTRYRAIAPERRRWLGFGVLMIVALVAGLSWYATRPDWRVLYSGLESKDVQQVAQELGAAGIPYQVSADQTGIEVSAEMLDKARMTVAAKGMPQTGRLGFELFDKPNWVGSEFDERVNYQRALEGELEHTIETLGDVRSARVHLVLPQQSLFADEAKAAKASVVMKLKHPAMSAEQAESIRNLVAGAVENLLPAQVTLVDADGRANLQANGSAASQELSDEQAMEARLVAMLEPLAGQGNVRATVNMTYSGATEERMDEVYDPSQSAALTVLKKEQSSTGALRPSGVPGTASNTPAAAAVGAVQGSAQAAAPGQPPLLAGSTPQPVFPTSVGAGQSIKEENGTYAVTKHTTHIEEGPGRVQRVTAAVVVNDRMATEGTGSAAHAVWHPRTADELHRLEQLAQAAVGFDAHRGDQVVLENVSFSSNVPEEKLEGMAKVAAEARTLLAMQPGMLKTVLFSLLGLLTVWFVLRPVAGQVVATLKEPLLLTASSSPDPRASVSMQARPQLQETVEVEVVREEQVAAVVAQTSPRRLQARPLTGNAVVEQIADHLRSEPARGTRLLEAWISSGAQGESR